MSITFNAVWALVIAPLMGKKGAAKTPLRLLEEWSGAMDATQEEYHNKVRAVARKKLSRKQSRKEAGFGDGAAEEGAAAAPARHPSDLENGSGAFQLGVVGVEELGKVFEQARARAGMRDLGVARLLSSSNPDERSILRCCRRPQGRSAQRSLGRYPSRGRRR